MNKAMMVGKLRGLRMQIEREMIQDGLGEELNEDQASLLADVCLWLDLDETETRYVMGAVVDEVMGPALVGVCEGRGLEPMPMVRVV
jgi:hypothetical protein